MGGKVHSHAFKKESNARGRCRRRAGPASQGFPPDPNLNHQHPGRVGDGDRGHRAARRPERSEPERRGSGRTVRSMTGAWRGEAMRPPPAGALPPSRPRRRTTAPATDACRQDAVASPDGAAVPKPAAPRARHGRRLDPRRHRHRRPRGLARRPPRVATREEEGKGRWRHGLGFRPGVALEQHGSGGGESCNKYRLCAFL